MAESTDCRNDGQAHRRNLRSCVNKRKSLHSAIRAIAMTETACPRLERPAPARLSAKRRGKEPQPLCSHSATLRGAPELTVEESRYANDGV